ncbi:MAG: hypothetical protein SFZ23_02910 [Planctomycetota bacterium]|nr:hypothetical protein [Planctomycetota bacterium]
MLTTLMTTDTIASTHTRNRAPSAPSLAGDARDNEVPTPPPLRLAGGPRISSSPAPAAAEPSPGTRSIGRRPAVAITVPDEIAFLIAPSGGSSETSRRELAIARRTLAAARSARAEDKSASNQQARRPTEDEALQIALDRMIDLVIAGAI